MALTKLTQIKGSVAKLLRKIFPLTFNSVDDMKSFEHCEEGLLVKTKGFYSKGDGGQASYLITKTGHADGYINHELQAGYIAALQFKDTIDLDSCGIQSDGDSSTLITTVVNSGLASNYVCNKPVTVSDVNLHTNNLTLTFYQDVKNTGKGFVFDCARSTLNLMKKYVGTECEVSGGTLVPMPTVESGFVMNGALNKIHMKEAYGFVHGIKHPATTSGFECRYSGHLTRCQTGVQLYSKVGSAIHEGNIWNLQMFQCVNGYIIEKGGNRYQQFGGVVDNAQITGGKDLRDAQGSHLIGFYFYRPSECVFTNVDESSIVTNLVGESRFGIEAANEYARLQRDSVIIKSDKARIDMKVQGSQFDYDYRTMLNTATGAKEFFAKDSRAAIKLLPSTFGQGALALNVVSGAYGSDWAKFSKPSKTTNGQVIVAYNTNFPTAGGDKDRLRIYVGSSAGFHIFSATGLLQ